MHLPLRQVSRTERKSHRSSLLYCTQDVPDERPGWAGLCRRRQTGADGRSVIGDRPRFQNRGLSPIALPIALKQQNARLVLEAGHRHFDRLSDHQLPVAGRISAIPTALKPLVAMAMLPSLVGIIWRTMPPPPFGIGKVWNFSVLGSKRTR